MRVPSVEEEDARRSHRERQRLIRERTGHINRIKGLLFGQGIRDIEPKLRLTRIDFAALETAEGHPLPDRLRRELEREYARLDLIETQFARSRRSATRRTRKTRRSNASVRCCVALRGIGGASAAILAREVFAPILREPTATGILSRPDTERLRQRIDDPMPGHFQGRQQLGAPGLIEIAWLWRKYQPASPLSKLVSSEDDRPIEPDPAHHADRPGPQARDLVSGAMSRPGSFLRAPSSPKRDHERRA